MKLKKVEDTWSNIAQNYQKLLPPNRPSDQDCSNYTKILKPLFAKGKKKILILGSSPKIRDLVCTISYQKFDVTCIDVTSDMYKAMSHLVWKLNKKEKFIIGNWLTLDKYFSKNSFDIVIGDEVISNIPLNKQVQLYTQISTVLKKDGVFITKHNYFKPMPQKKFLKEIAINVLKVDKGLITIQQSVNNLAILCFYYSASIHNGIASVSDGYNIIIHNKKTLEKKVGTSTPMLHQILNDFKTFFNPQVSKYHWTVLNKNKTELGLNKYFHIKGAIFSCDYITAAYSPIYILTKKHE